MMEAGTSILPDIIDVARDHGLSLRQAGGRPGEYRANCPFCSGGDRGRHLYINSAKNTFNCFKCGEKGGVLAFLARLEGRSELAVLEDLRDEKKVKPRRFWHPAERLTADQLKMMGFVGGRPDWYAERRKDPDYARRLADWIWAEWQKFIDYEKYCAALLLLVAVRFGFYRKAAVLVRKRGEQLGLPLAEEAVRGVNNPDPPGWARAAKKASVALEASLQRAAVEGADPELYLAVEEARQSCDLATWAEGLAQFCRTAVEKGREKLAV
jgi:hypothetical protein